MFHLAYYTWVSNSQKSTTEKTREISFFIENRFVSHEDNLFLKNVSSYENYLFKTTCWQRSNREVILSLSSVLCVKATSENNSRMWMQFMRQIYTMFVVYFHKDKKLMLAFASLPDKMSTAVTLISVSPNIIHVLSSLGFLESLSSISGISRIN